MAAIAGWIIICTGFCLVSAALLWPAYRRTRHRFTQARQARWAYALASAGCGVALWYLIPLVVWVLIGRTAH